MSSGVQIIRFGRVVSRLCNHAVLGGCLLDMPG
jgi:hypothetical protein